MIGAVAAPLHGRPTPDASRPWIAPVDEQLALLGSSAEGLTQTEASARLAAARASRRVLGRESHPTARLLVAQFRSPILLLLIASAVLSFALGEQIEASIILVVILASASLGFWQEHRAAVALERLLGLVRVKARVLRDGATVEIPIDEVVPGDVVLLSAGKSIPGDCRVLECNTLFVDESALTGESFPVEKGLDAHASGGSGRSLGNALYYGTSVVSGTARAIVVHIGRDTALGEISEHLLRRPPETEFEHGVRRFGYLLMEVTAALVLFVFAVNVALHRPILETFLFSLALAVGLTPQLLPAIVGVTLARGAREMARVRVLVKRVAAIEDFGSMDTLCIDKTGTVTEGVVRVHSAVDIDGAASDRVLRFACANAALQRGYDNPLDDTLRALGRVDLEAFRKVAERPYDFTRRRLSVITELGDARLVITKGAVPSVLSICTEAERADGSRVPMEAARVGIDRTFAALSAQGLRSLGVAIREDPGGDQDPERAMCLLGLVAFYDPPKAGVTEQLAALTTLGVRLKLVTGDNSAVAATVARTMGLDASAVTTGADVQRLTDHALRQHVARTAVFADVDPVQKERIVAALRGGGSVVGFLGDGINDAGALHAADVGISVDSAADVAKQAADIVLLEKDLGVLVAGIREGRRVFQNTLKYIFITTSANFGNMISMAAASLFMAFLPLLPEQILLINLLTDLPSMALATDRVDPELIERPRRWSNRLIRNFMLSFGLLSSVFDAITFASLLWLQHNAIVGFRTGWFVESILSEVGVLLVIRTRRAFFRSPLGGSLLAAVLIVAASTLLVPFSPVAPLLSLAPLSVPTLLLLLGITLAYVTASELTKRAFFRIARREWLVAGRLPLVVRGRT